MHKGHVREFGHRPVLDFTLTVSVVSMDYKTPSKFVTYPLLVIAHHWYLRVQQIYSRFPSSAVAYDRNSRPRPVQFRWHSRLSSRTHCCHTVLLYTLSVRFRFSCPCSGNCSDCLWSVILNWNKKRFGASSELSSRITINRKLSVGTNNEIKHKSRVEKT